MLDRWVEGRLLDTLENEGIGCILFSSLAQGLLTSKYLNGIPENSRAAKDSGFLQRDEVSDAVIEKMRALNELAARRGQKLAQMALAWVLRQPAVTSTIIGASRISHIEDAVGALDNLDFTAAELSEIETILAGTTSPC
jgi:L-glyceraldehyde 3-phosphate reductase